MRSVLAIALLAVLVSAADMDFHMAFIKAMYVVRENGNETLAFSMFGTPYSPNPVTPELVWPNRTTGSTLDLMLTQGYYTNMVDCAYPPFSFCTGGQANGTYTVLLMMAAREIAAHYAVAFEARYYTDTAMSWDTIATYLSNYTFYTQAMAWPNPDWLGLDVDRNVALLPAAFWIDGYEMLTNVTGVDFDYSFSTGQVATCYSAFDDVLFYDLIWTTPVVFTDCQANLSSFLRGEMPSILAFADRWSVTSLAGTLTGAWTYIQADVGYMFQESFIVGGLYPMLGLYKVSGRVDDAVNGNYVHGATVMFDGYVAFTDDTGVFDLGLIYNLTYNVYITAPGYIDLSTTISIPDFDVDYYDGVSFSMVSQVPFYNDSWRFVLHWNAYPRDLDTHVWTAWGFEVYYSQKDSIDNGAEVHLDRDCTSGYGPETTTFTNCSNYPGSYQLWIYQYSSGYTWTQAGAYVDIYRGDSIGYVGRVLVMPDGDTANRWWHVLNILSTPLTSSLMVVNEVSTSPPEFFYVTGFVRSSVTGDYIEGALVTLSSATFTATYNTTASGYYTFPSVLADTYLLYVTATGYGNYAINITVTDDIYGGEANAFLIEILSGGDDTIRFILTWFATPSDLDSYSYLPYSNYSVYYGRREQVAANNLTTCELDLDQTGGWGPETTTWYTISSNTGRYEFWVHIYSSGGYWTGSGARVDTYHGGSAFPIHSEFAPLSDDYTYDWWRVVRVDSHLNHVVSFNYTHELYQEDPEAIGMFPWGPTPEFPSSSSEVIPPSDSASSLAFSALVVLLALLL